MTNYQSLLAQRAELEQAIEAARREELAAAITEARSLVETYGLLVSDLFPDKNSKALTTARKVKAKIAPKYRNPATGATWTGRGKEPLWIAGKDRAPFCI